jgi:hypothetical protein
MCSKNILQSSAPDFSTEISMAMNFLAGKNLRRIQNFSESIYLEKNFVVFLMVFIEIFATTTQ